jgi:phospholipase A1/A2
VYLLPATYTDNLNRRPSSPSAERSATTDQVLRHIEAKYQLSFKSKFAGDIFGSRVSLWGGYTQSSRWQVYNGAVSRPFRETNYEPELIAAMPLSQPLLGGTVRLASLSLNHQSNGRSLPLSRSWNRWIASAAWERGQWVVELRPWWRIPEAAAEDDNPDIRDHVGRAELLVGRWWGDHALQLQLRHSLRGGERSRGSAQLEWAFPIRRSLHGWLQVFSGYGESLVDYNQRQNKVGLGVTIAGWR